MDAKMAAIGVQIEKLTNQYRTAIQEGITNFKDPELYDSESITIHPWTKGFVIKWGSGMLTDLGESHFNYLTSRYEEGFVAFIEKDWRARGASPLKIYFIDGVKLLSLIIRRAHHRLNFAP